MRFRDKVAIVTGAAPTVAAIITVAVEGITLGVSIREVFSLVTRPGPIIPGKWQYLQQKEPPKEETLPVLFFALYSLPHVFRDSRYMIGQPVPEKLVYILVKHISRAFFAGFQFVSLAGFCLLTAGSGWSPG